MGITAVSNGTDVAAAKTKSGIIVKIKDVDVASELAKPAEIKSKPEFEEKKEDTSVFGKIKNWLKNPFNLTGVGFAGLGAGVLAAALLTSSSAIAALAIFGIFSIFVGGCSICQGYELSKKEEYEAIEKEKLAEMAQTKADEKNSKALDTSNLQTAPKLYGTQELISFKTKSGVVSDKVNIPEAVKMNQLFEKYSTEENPDIEEDETQELLKTAKNLFAQVKEKSKVSYIQEYKNYSFGQNIGESEKLVAQKEKSFEQLIAAYTDESSSSGKKIDKSELLELREKTFQLLNAQ